MGQNVPNAMLTKLTELVLSVSSAYSGAILPLQLDNLGLMGCSHSKNTELLGGHPRFSMLQAQRVLSGKNRQGIPGLWQQPLNYPIQPTDVVEYHGQ
jgi:hypothetical protein